MGLVEMPLRPAVVSAVSWRISAELLRRHYGGPVSLRMYPGDQWECLSLAAGVGDAVVPLCDFRQKTGLLHLRGHLHPPVAGLRELGWPRSGDFAAAYLTAADPLRVCDQIESVLGLPPAPHPLPEPAAAVVSTRLLAEILAWGMIERIPYEVLSGHEEGGLARELLQVAPISAELPLRPDAMATFARRFRVVRRGGEPVAVVDMQGAAYTLRPPPRRIDLLEQWHGGREVAQVTAAVLQLC